MIAGNVVAEEVLKFITMFPPNALVAPKALRSGEIAPLKLNSVGLVTLPLWSEGFGHRVDLVPADLGAATADHGGGVLGPQAHQVAVQRVDRGDGLGVAGVGGVDELRWSRSVARSPGPCRTELARWSRR